MDKEVEENLARQLVEWFGVKRCEGPCACLGITCHDLGCMQWWEYVLDLSPAQFERVLRDGTKHAYDEPAPVLELTLASLEVALASLNVDNPTLCVSPELERVGLALVRTFNISFPDRQSASRGIGLKVVMDWQGKQWDVQGEQCT